MRKSKQVMGGRVYGGRPLKKGEGERTQERRADRGREAEAGPSC